ncbi:hypothetical protein CK203_112460 [Vitis vinifera]|uniref:Uncharacterized protein n=1 Tax=Vitis vinifera TaxID=29760 RepID=A0A438CWX2_VITVI|nr:hypothetical protein CK203_112460 [Vitis vinifera]
MEKDAISLWNWNMRLWAINKLNMDLSRAGLKRGDFKVVGHILKDSCQRKNLEEKNSPRHLAHPCENFAGSTLCSHPSPLSHLTPPSLSHSTPPLKHGPKAYFSISIWHGPEGPLLPLRRVALQDSEFPSDMSPGSIIRCPMLTTLPIEGNSDYRSRPFHSEFYFDQEAFR